MPISRREFESGEFDPGLLLIEYLRSNADYAYTAKELKKELASRGTDVTLKVIRKALGTLQGQGRVETETVRDVVYYIYSRRIGYRTS